MEADPAAMAGASAMVVTSANAVPALRRVAADLTTFAVGPDTAAALAGGGFRNVLAAEGPAEDLLELIARKWRHQDGPLIHASGGHLSVDVCARLAFLGYDCSRLEVYAAEKVRHLTPAIARQMRRGGFDAVLFMSARTAEAFMDVVTASRPEESCRAAVCVSLSDAIGSRLQHLPWRQSVVAPVPTRAGILAAVDAVAGRCD